MGNMTKRSLARAAASALLAAAMTLGGGPMAMAATTPRAQVVQAEATGTGWRQTTATRVLYGSWQRRHIRGILHVRRKVTCQRRWRYWRNGKATSRCEWRTYKAYYTKWKNAEG